jgi:hypothetical protein
VGARFASKLEIALLDYPQLVITREHDRPPSRSAARRTRSIIGGQQRINVSLRRHDENG